MEKLNFDLTAMIQPKNSSDIAAMLREAVDELRSISEHFDAMFEADVATRESA
jgi:hypothetical protein